MHKLIIMSALLVLFATEAQAKKGFYFGFNLGGALVSGDTAIPMQNPQKDPDYKTLNNGVSATDVSVLFSTDEGSGFATGFRMGYNILGFVGIELLVAASGNELGDGNKISGQGGIFGVVRLFPAQLFDEVKDRWWDPYIFVGGGAHFIGYNPDAHPTADNPKMQNDGRAWWPGTAVTYGLGCDFYLVDFFSLGVDLAFYNVFHDDFHIDDDDDITDSPIETAGAFIFAPTAKLTFHFGTE